MYYYNEFGICALNLRNLISDKEPPSSFQEIVFVYTHTGA